MMRTEMRTEQETAPSGLRLLDPERLPDYLDQLYRAAFGLCGTQADAEDLVQETCVRVLSKPRFIRHGDLSYLLRALRNTFYSQCRAAGRRPCLVTLPETGDATTGRHLPSLEVIIEAREVYRAIAELPELHRDVLVAVDVVGLSYREAGAVLGIPEGTVMSRLFRARQRLARKLG